MFYLKLLGTLSLQLNSGPEPPVSLQKKRLELLALVAIGQTRGISRERIQSYLWPESDSTRARHALDQLIYATRRSLGRDPFADSGSELRLNAGIIQTDLRLFEEALATGDPESAAERYAGSLLHGFNMAHSRDLETWIDSERVRLARAYEGALETLARTCTSAGNPNAALRWWRKLSAADPLSSRIALEVMRALERAGDRPAALQHARAYQRLVREELGVSADPELCAYALSLRSALDTRTPQEMPASVIAATVPAPSPDSAPVASEPGVIPTRRKWPRTTSLRSLALLATLLATTATRQTGNEAVDTDIQRSAAKRLYLSGVNSWNDRSPEGLDSAVVDFRRAVERDPMYADAYAGLANAYVMIGYSGYRPAQAMFPKARAAALRSIGLDSTRAASFAALGMELTWERRFADAERAFQKALALDPEYATAHQWYGILLMILGKKQEAVAELKRAAELDPLSLQIQNNYATFLGAIGDRDAQRKHYEKVVAQEPDSAWVRRNPWLLTNLAAAYTDQRRFGRALWAAQEAVRILPGHPRAVGSLASVYRAMGDSVRADSVYATVDTTNEHYPAYRALWYLNAGNLDSAFVWFDRVNEWAIPVMISLPGLRPEVRSDPRFQKLMKRVGIPQASMLPR